MSHESQESIYVDPEKKDQIRFYSKQLDCTVDEFVYCISKVGKSLKAIQLFLEMNRDTIEAIVQRELKKN
jgi:hypothetical protein